MAKLFEQGYALLIGVGRSVCPEWSLPVTVRDVQALKAVLTNPSHCGYLTRRVRLLRNEDATKGNILGAMDTLAKATAQKPEATVVIYYSGHGWLKKDGRHFLIPHDAVPRTLLSTALSAERFIKSLRQIQSRRLLVILDTCHAEGMATAKKIPKCFDVHAEPEDLAQKLSRGSGRAVLTSCRGTESSWILPDQSLSLFTHHLIEALKGSKSGEQFVSVLSLMHYVAQEVPKRAQELGQQQTPFFKFESEDFPVAWIRGGKEVQERNTEEDPLIKLGHQQERLTQPRTVRIGRDKNTAIGSNARIDTGASISIVNKNDTFDREES